MNDFGFPFICGFIAALLIASCASGLIMGDRIEAGLFERNGVAYRIERVTP